MLSAFCNFRIQIHVFNWEKIIIKIHRIIGQSDEVHKQHGPTRIRTERERTANQRAIIIVVVVRVIQNLFKSHIFFVFVFGVCAVEFWRETRERFAQSNNTSSLLKTIHNYKSFLFNFFHCWLRCTRIVSRLFRVHNNNIFSYCWYLLLLVVIVVVGVQQMEMKRLWVRQ